MWFGEKPDTMQVGVLDMEPCDRCAAWMLEGIMLISVKDDSVSEIEFQRATKHPMPDPYRTGNVVVVTEESIRQVAVKEVANEIVDRRWAFVQDSVWEAIGLPVSEDLMNE